MTPLTLSHPPLPGLSLAWLAPLLARLAGRTAGWPDRLEDWQLRDLNLTRVYPGPCHPTHIELP